MTNIENFKKRKELLKIFTNAIDEVADIVLTTAGPGGQYVGLVDDGSITSTKDGKEATIFYNQTDPYMLYATDGVGRAADATELLVGDGTTLTTIMFKKIWEELVKLDHHYYREISKELKEVQTDLFRLLKNHSYGVGDFETTLRILNTSLNGDSEMFDAMKEAFEFVGVDGFIESEEDEREDTHVKILDGYVNGKGVLHRAFIDGKASMKLINPYVLILNEEIDLVTLDKIVDNILEVDGDCVIVAKSYDEDVVKDLALLAKDFAKKDFRLVFVIVDNYGDNATNNLQDIAEYTGGRVLGKFGNDLDKLPECLGAIKECHLSLEEVKFVGGSISDEYKGNLQDVLKSTTDSFKKNKVRKRLSMLDRGRAVIRLGGNVSAQGAKKGAFEDALLAARSANIYGAIDGGGGILQKIVDELDLDRYPLTRHIVVDTLKEQTNVLASNLGVSNYEILESARISNSSDPVMTPYYAFKHAVEGCLQLFNTSTVITRS